MNRTIRVQSDMMTAVKDVNARLAQLRKDGKAPLDLADNTKTGTYAALSAFLDADPHELAPYNSVAKLAEDISGRAHATFAEAIGRMRSKMLGFKESHALELDFLRAAFGQDAPAIAREDAAAWAATEGPLAERYIQAGGALAKREGYFPNPSIDQAKARAIGEDAFKNLVRDVVDRAKVIDFLTQKPMSDVRFEQLLDEAWRSIDGADLGAPKAFHGKTMLANGRDAPRLFWMRDAESWMKFAETVGTHTSPFQAAMAHIRSIARDTAMLERLGPNPDATLAFMQDVLDKDAARVIVRANDLTKASVKDATKTNRKIEARAASQKKSLGNLYAEISGSAHVPVHTIAAQRLANARAWLVSAQLGSAMLSSLNDPATLTMGAKMAGLKASNVLHWTAHMLTEKDAEVFAAQTGFMMDAMAHSARGTDKIMGETIRSGWAAKMSEGVIRASGLRRWTEGLKGGFWLGAIAQVAHERGKAFADLDPAFRQALERVGIGDAEWKIYRQAPLYEPRPESRIPAAAGRSQPRRPRSRTRGGKAVAIRQHLHGLRGARKHAADPRPCARRHQARLDLGRAPPHARHVSIFLRRAVVSAWWPRPGARLGRVSPRPRRDHVRADVAARRAGDAGQGSRIGPRSDPARSDQCTRPAGLGQGDPAGRRPWRVRRHSRCRSDALRQQLGVDVRRAARQHDR